MSADLSTLAAESLLREFSERRRAQNFERDALRLSMRLAEAKSVLERVDRVARIGIAFAPPAVSAELRAELDKCAAEVTP
mgnify:FL=1|jgi:cytosine/adenosine deaminase-related metal-dependent hydrolase